MKRGYVCFIPRVTFELYFAANQIFPRQEIWEFFCLLPCYIIQQGSDRPKHSAIKEGHRLGASKQDVETYRYDD